jgi:carbon-monoxide dehydrogenase large subunit
LKVKIVASWILKVPAQEIKLSNGSLQSKDASISLENVARTWYLRPQDLPATTDFPGLEVVGSYRMERDSGTFGYGVHAAVVAVDVDSGDIEILDYVIVEDGGTMINPMVVDGQIYGGTAQGIGTALYEEMGFDERGQPLGSTFADYLLPGPTEVPNIRLFHLETPSPYTRFGQKGIGESGAIAPPAAITNAINDALYELGAEILESPVTPYKIIQAITESRKQNQEFFPTSIQTMES